MSSAWNTSTSAKSGERSPKSLKTEAKMSVSTIEKALRTHLKTLILPYNERHNYKPQDWIPIPLPLPTGKVLDDRLFTTCAPKELTSIRHRYRFQRLCEDKKVTHIINLMERHEDTAHAQICLDSYYKEIGMTVIRFPLRKDQQPESSKVLSLIKQILTALSKGERLMIHCDDGCDRTGMLLMIILRALGIKSNPLLQMRKINSNFVKTKEFEKFAMEIKKSRSDNASENGSAASSAGEVRA